ncbi:putative DNA modification/repair radical SAM protein [Geobacter hydrogenophilus]|uniref:DNA modification/repair radical SAM protein n=1 Tax=Geobacter hydrogenophilus TaxID=40983 RepID=A0A9W6G0H0_9BACT|nr:putative DNA modification/repair radical SAM protein [Geobacter hydrogenophilus]MBT0893889.1 putative DNA modification/repair radical SAM protein [Geobacter hydrogenophilus]GLI38167.1 putative DNA modification/repair radical SAM protein [Geobacter hydrogenophilus]
MPELTLAEKLEILADGAKYDVSCASSGSSRRNKGGIGNAAQCGICHSWTADGRCVSLLKILLTNACIYDCAYCVNRRSNDTRRVILTPAEVAELTIGFYRRNAIEGLFLSTGVVKDPDHTMELLIEATRILREEHRFNGYIHVKVVPGADLLLVDRLGRLADRVSVNMELPSRESLKLLAPDKSREAIVAPMKRVGELIVQTKEERKVSRKIPPFAPAGQSTQLIVGASGESDLQIVSLAAGLYGRLAMKRVYYSAFIPVNTDERLPTVIGTPPLVREHRLYQADWLMRYYGFAAGELLDEERPNLDLALDPKAGWALRNLHLFPLEVNRAPLELLLRVPGIGVRSAQRIVGARRGGHLSLDDLARLGVVMKRARYFITARGRFGADLAPDAAGLRLRLTERATAKIRWSQPSLFDAATAIDIQSSITGEL